MTEKKVVFAPRSLADIQRIFGFYSAIEAGLQPTVSRRLLQAFKIIAKFPDIGRLLSRPDAIREFVSPFGKGSFVIRYQTARYKIHVLHVWHTLEDRG